MLGSSGSRRLKNHHFSIPNYLNFEIDESIVVEYNHANTSFTAIETSKVNHQFVSKSRNPLLIITPTVIFLWLPDSYWADQLRGKQQLALVITEVCNRKSVW